MNRRLAVIALSGAALVAVPAIASVTPAQAGLLSPVTNLLTGTTKVGAVVKVNGTLLGGVGRVSGSVKIKKFINLNNAVHAVGDFTGKVVDGAGRTVSGVTQDVVIPVVDVVRDAAVDVVHVELSALANVKLLGKVVSLSGCVLDISTDSGLVGGLLDTVVGLLDSDGPVDQTVAALNEVLGLL